MGTWCSMKGCDWVLESFSMTLSRSSAFGWNSALDSWTVQTREVS